MARRATAGPLEERGSHAARRAAARTGCTGGAAPRAPSGSGGAASPPSTNRALTALLAAWNGVDDEALHRLLPRVMDELRCTARLYLAREAPPHTLEPTALVNEVYLRLVGQRPKPFANRGEFFGFAGRLMREILVDHARVRRAAKRGGGARPAPLERCPEPAAGARLSSAEMLDLDRALTALGASHPRQRKVVELRYFLGLTVPEVARALDQGRATVERDWAFARRWLAREMRRGGAPAVGG